MLCGGSLIIISFIFESLVLVALIKQELNSRQLHSIIDGMDSEDKDYSSLLESVRNMDIFNENSEKLLQRVNDKLTILQTDSVAKASKISDIVNKLNKASEDLERLHNDSKAKEQMIDNIEKNMSQNSDELVNLHLNMTSFNNHSEKLLRDLINQSRADFHDKLENLNDILGLHAENKTSQINHIFIQINRTSDDLWNLHRKIGNITSSLDKLDEIKQHLESEKIISKLQNISLLFSEENEATRQMLTNISDITFRSFSNQSEAENRQMTGSVTKILESIELLHKFIGQSLEIINKIFNII